MTSVHTVSAAIVAVVVLTAHQPQPGRSQTAQVGASAPRQDVITKPTRAGLEASTSDAKRAWTQAPRILKRIAPHKFHAREFDIRSFGAVGEGQTDCTAAFKAAIEACGKAGGGKVVVPAGTFLTSAIHLKSSVNLHVTGDGTILFSPDSNKYLPVVFTRYEGTELMNFSPFIMRSSNKTAHSQGAVHLTRAKVPRCGIIGPDWGGLTTCVWPN